MTDLEYELYHAGVKGMKWGVRNDKNKSLNTKRRGTSSAEKTTITKRGDTTIIKARSGDQKAKLTVKRDKGAKFVAKSSNTKLKVIISNTATVASGALWVASAFMPGLPILNTVAAAANLVGIATSHE